MAPQRNPAASPEIELRNVKKELDATKKRLERYRDLVAKLCNELDTLRNNICDKCKQKVVNSDASSKGPSALALCPRMEHSVTVPSSSSDNWRMPTVQSIDTPPTLPVWLPVLPGAATTTIQPPTENVSFRSAISPPATKSPPKLVNRPDWSVVYNPDIKRTLDLPVAETLKCGVVVWDVKFSRNGKYLAVAVHGGETRIYDLKTLSKSVLAEHTAKPEEKSDVVCLQFSPDDVYIATGLADGRILMWNVAQKRVLARFKGQTPNAVSSVEFSPNSRFLVSASWDQTVRLWCIRDGSSKILSAGTSMFNSVAFSPDGRYVFSGDDDGVLGICDTRTVKLVEKWRGHEDVVWCLRLSKDGKGLVSGGKDIILKYWDVSSYTDLGSGLAGCSVNTGTVSDKKEILRFDGHDGRISSIALSSDSRWVFSSGGPDCTIRIWDAKTGSCHCTLKGHKSAIQGTDLCPTGQLLASGSQDGCVWLWKYNVSE